VAFVGVNRIAVLGVTGAVTTVRPDGSGARVVAAGGGGRIALCVGPLDPGRDRRVLVEEGGLGVPLMRWLVWEGVEARPLGRPFTPTGWWARTELAFPEQFGQSRRCWSPDSRSFAYAVHGEDGRDVIVVQTADVVCDDTPTELCPSLAASWSPA